MLPLDVVQGQGAEFRDPESGIQQGPDDQLLLGAPARVGEPIGLFGPEGLADELVGHLLTCLATRSVRSRTAIPNSVRFLPKQGIRRRMAITAGPACVFGRHGQRGVGGGNPPSSRYYTEGELTLESGPPCRRVSQGHSRRMARPGSSPVTTRPPMPEPPRRLASRPRIGAGSSVPATRPTRRPAPRWRGSAATTGIPSTPSPAAGDFPPTTPRPRSGLLRRPDRAGRPGRRRPGAGAGSAPSS